MKKVLLVLALLLTFTLTIAVAQEKVYVFGTAQVLNGFNIYNKATGELVCFAASDLNGKFDCDVDSSKVITVEQLTEVINAAVAEALKDLEFEAVPVWLDANEPDPEPEPEPEWKPRKDNAFRTSCKNCHATETDEEYEFDEWDTDRADWSNPGGAPKDKGHKKHMTSDKLRMTCLSCHRKPL